MAKICQNESFRHFPRPRKTKQNRTRNEAKTKVTMIILGISSILLTNFYNCLASLVQTQLSHYPYRPTLNYQISKEYFTTNYDLYSDNVERF